MSWDKKNIDGIAKTYNLQAKVVSILEDKNEGKHFALN